MHISWEYEDVKAVFNQKKKSVMISRACVGLTEKKWREEVK